MARFSMARRVERDLLMFVLLVISLPSALSVDELKQTITKDNITLVYKNIGCFKDAEQRTLPELLGDWRTLPAPEIISKCANITWYKGYEGFGVQFFGECWSGVNAVRTYDKHQNSSGCFNNGIGGYWANTIYFFTNTKPQITTGPSSWKGTSGKLLTLRCQVKSPFAAHITWYTNFDDEDPLPTGHTLSVKAVAGEQGTYWCKVTTPYGLQAQSEKALIIVKDYFTTVVRFRVKSQKSRRISRSRNLCQPCQQVVDYLTEQSVGLEYSRGPCRTWSSSHVVVECTIYRRRSDQDITDYYKNLLSTLVRGARRNNPLPIYWNTITVKDAEYCIRQTTGKSSFQGVFQWHSLSPGQTSTVDCPYGPSGANASRSCTGDFTRGVSWNDPYVDECGFNSKKTDDFHKLSKIQVNAKNAKEVAKNLTQLFNSHHIKDMTESDAELAADIVENIIALKDKLNETADLVFEVIDRIMEMNKTTLAKSDQIATKIIKALDALAENIPMKQGTTTTVLKTTNLVLQANDITKTSYKGITFGVTKDGSIAASSKLTTTSVKLPSSLLSSTDKESVRIGFIYYANNKLFQVKPDEDDEDKQANQSTLSGQVLSSSVYNTNTSSLSQPVILRFARPVVPDEGLVLNSTCVFWNVEEQRWSSFGCGLCKNRDDVTDENSVECCCNHLTSFAVLFSPETPKPSTKAYESHSLALSIITYVGCAISLVGVLLTFLTYLLFRHLRKTNQQSILMNLCVAIALLLIVFVAGVNSTNNRLGCQIVAVLLHYFTLVTVLWMGIEAYNLYLQIVKVMAIYQRKFMLKAAVVGWGVPLLIVLATVIAAVIEHSGNNDAGRMFYYGNDNVCVLHNNLYRITSWFTPILVILLSNLVMFVLVIYKLNSTGSLRPVDSKSNQKSRCWTAFAIMVLLGLTWLFGALAISDARIVFEYLFCIFNSFQGFFIFFFHCVRIKEVRNQWSFFVSGLGLSHRESETSHQRSKGFGESYHSSEAPFVKVRDWIQKDSDPPKRKETMLTNVSEKHEERYDIELDGNRNNTDN